MNTTEREQKTREYHFKRPKKEDVVIEIGSKINGRYKETKSMLERQRLNERQIKIKNRAGKDLTEKNNEYKKRCIMIKKQLREN